MGRDTQMEISVFFFLLFPRLVSSVLLYLVSDCLLVGSMDDTLTSGRLGDMSFSYMSYIIISVIYSPWVLRLVGTGWL